MHKEQEIRDSVSLGTSIFSIEILKHMGARFGIESTLGTWDAKNKHRDYGIVRTLGSE